MSRPRFRSADLMALLAVVAAMFSLCVATCRGQIAWGSPSSGWSAGSNCGPSGQAQQPARYEKFAAFVRVAVQDRGGTRSLGSGTVIHDFGNGTGLVATNHHVVGERAADDAVWIDFLQVGVSGWQGQVVGDDPTWDVAVVAVHLPPRVTAVKIRENLVELGESLTVYGYPRGREPIYFANGRLQKYMLAPDRSREPYMLYISTPVVSGCSGGAVIDSQGRLAAVLWGSDGRTTTATACARVLDFFRRIRDRLAGKIRPAQPGGGRGDVALVPVPGKPSEPNRPDDSGGELARLHEELDALKGRLADDAQGAGLSIAEDAAEAAAPKLIDAFLPNLLSWLGLAAGSATGIGGVGLAGWLALKGAGKLLRGIGSAIARRRAGKASQTTNTTGGTPAIDPQSIVQSEVNRLASALKADLQSTIDAKLSLIGQQAKATAEIVASKPDPAPQFVPTQVENPQLVALEQALTTFGSQTPANSKWVGLIYKYRDQLLNQAKPAA